MLRLLVLLLTLGAAFGADTFPLGTPNVVTGPDLGVKAPLGSGRPQTIAQVIAEYPFTAINATGPTYTCATGSFDPQTNAIRYPNQRRQRTITINGTNYSADLIEGSATCLLAAGTCETFTVGWTTGTGTPTVTDAATTGVAGDTDAASFVEGVANGQQEIRQSVTKAASSLAYVGSVYMKNLSGTRSVVVELDDGTLTNGVSLTMNPSTGAIVSAPAAFGAGWALNTAAMSAAYTITSPSAGWYRVALTATSDATTTVRFRVALSNGSTTSYAGNGTSGVYVWGAGLRQANWAASYISCRNLLTRSEDWSATWVALNTSQTAAAAANPLAGDTTATSLTDTATNAAHNYRNSFTKAASSQTFTFSDYAKANTLSWLVLKAAGSTASTNSAGAYFDLTNGATGSSLTSGAGWSVVSKSITSAGGGWYRCAVTVTSASETLIVPFVGLASADATQSYAGTGKSLYTYGAQLQYGSAATTYWATTTAVGLRAAGLLLSTQTLGTTRGTLLGLMIPHGWSGHFNNSTPYRIISSQGTATDGEIRGATGGASNVITCTRNDAAAVNNVSQATVSPTISDGTPIQFGFTWNATSTALCVNGASEATDASTPTLPYNTVTGTSIGPNSGANQPNAYVLGLYSATVIPGSAQAAIFAASSAP